MHIDAAIAEWAIDSCGVTIVTGERVTHIFLSQFLVTVLRSVLEGYNIESKFGVQADSPKLSFKSPLLVRWLVSRVKKKKKTSDLRSATAIIPKWESITYQPSKFYGFTLIKAPETKLSKRRPWNMYVSLTKLERRTKAFIKRAKFKFLFIYFYFYLIINDKYSQAD